jgi:hypothetical protein
MPLIVEELFRRRADDDPTVLLTFFPFFWAAIFSAAFLCGCVISRAAHAATVGLAAMLLIYLLPLILPPLRWMNVADSSNQYFDGRHGWWLNWTDLWSPQRFGFVCGMTAFSVAMAAVSLVAVTRMWRIESGQKMLYGAVAASLLLLFASAAYQLGTNLPVQQQVDLPQSEYVFAIYMDGMHGFEMSYPTYRRNPQWTSVVRSIDVDADGIKLGKAVSTDGRPFWGSPEGAATTTHLFWLEERDPPKLSDDSGSDRMTIVLHSSNLVTGGKSTEVALWQMQRVKASASVWLWQNKLYVYGNRLVVLDVTDADRPRLISDSPFEVKKPGDWLVRLDGIVFPLLQLPGLPEDQQLAASVRWSHFNRDAFDGQTLCTDSYGGLNVYRFAGIEGQGAVFKDAGHYSLDFLQRLSGTTGGNRPALRNGLLYEGGWRHSIFNSAISIYDVRNPDRIKRVGHFAAPGAELVCPLPDGRAIVGGSKLWLVGPPPNRDN